MGMRLSGFSFPSARRSKVRTGVLAICVVAATLAACDNVFDDDEETMHVRAINLISDSPTLNFMLGETSVASSVGYVSGSSFSPAPPGTYDVQLRATRPPFIDDDDDTTNNDEYTDPIPLGTPISLSFQRDTDYTLIAYGTVANPQLIVMSGTGLREELEDNTHVWQLVHAATNVGAVEIYITSEDMGIPSRQFLTTLNPTQHSEPTVWTLPPVSENDEDSTRHADMTLEIVEVSTGNILYTSPTIRGYERTRMLYTITDNGEPGPAPVRLVSTDIGGTSGSLFDAEDEAAVRFAHVSHDTPALDVLPGSSLSQPLAQNIGFRQISGYVNVEPDEINLIGVPTGNPGVFLFLEEFDASRMQHYTAYAVGTLSDLDAVVLTDTRRGIATQMQFRLLHAAPSLEDADDFDVYVTLPDRPVEFDTDGDDIDEDPTPDFANFGYEDFTSYKTLRPGAYDLHFALAGTQTIHFGPIRIEIPGGSIRTLVLTDTPEGTIELLSFEDAAP